MGQSLRTLISLMISMVLLIQPQVLLAQISTSIGSKGQGGSEYFVGREFGKPLVTVNLISGVTKPGVYHVPVDTDLSQLLAYAGGANPKADLENITIRRRVKDTTEAIDIDLEDLISQTSSMPRISDRDVVHIPNKEEWEKTMRWVALVSGITGIILSGYLIYDIDQRNR